MKKFFVFFALLAAPLVSFAQETQALSVPVNAVALSPMAIQPMAQNQYLDYNFGSVYVGSQYYVDFIVRANGSGTNIRGIYLNDGQNFQVSTNCPRYLYGGQECVVRAFFNPRFSGQHWANLDIRFDYNSTFIRLYGNAYY